MSLRGRAVIRIGESKNEDFGYDFDVKGEGKSAEFTPSIGISGLLPSAVNKSNSEQPRALNNSYSKPPSYALSTFVI